MTTLQTSDRATETPTKNELVQRARDLGPLLADNAAKGESDGRVAQESIDALTEAGLFKLAVPKRYGGYETNMRTLMEVTAAIGEADGGTAWVATILNGTAWLTGLFSQRAQDDVFGSDPDARVCGVITPSSQATKVDGGYRVSGRWFFASGSSHATWAVVAIPVTNAEGETIDGGMALVPATDYRIEKTWYVAGMKSTGSNCIVVEDVFVPDHRVMSVSQAIQGTYATEHTDETMYRSSFVPFLTLNMVGPQLGMGRAALRMVTEKASKKSIAYTHFDTQADSVAFQLAIAKAATKLDTAMLHAYRAADDVDNAAADGAYLDYTTRARVRADTGKAVETVVEAINDLLFASGAGSFAENNALQRIWRDSSTGARHAHVIPDIGYEVYGKALLGVDNTVTDLV
ncbi:acyl-CoA dehydrogenase family protein [Rhodococcus sp. NPDC019627]|uniref:acyl-CoA dehydrogenase family protein n=1 Tax=unclassified Rhodococcus (in: high G+C Gram-positive bacteria) TaxID=192944 RepID=UPI0033DD8300